MFCVEGTLWDLNAGSLSSVSKTYFEKSHELTKSSGGVSLAL